MRHNYYYYGTDMSLDALENKQTQNTIMIRSKPDYVATYCS